MLRILIVEDSDNKFRDVHDRLLANFQVNRISIDGIERAESYTDAVMLIQASYFDIIILDLKIPLVKNGNPDFAGSATLLEFISSRPDVQPFKIIGLTSYIYEDYLSERIGRLSINVESYSSENFSWVERLSAEISSLFRSKAGLMRYFGRSFDLDVLFIVARHDNEFVPVSEAMTWVGEPGSDSRLRKQKNLRGKIELPGRRVITAALVCAQDTGLSTTAALIGYCVSIFRPRYIVMVGMCCGLNDHRSPYKPMIGDVVIATETVCWDEGKYSEELTHADPFFVRTTTRVPDTILRQSLREFLETCADKCSAATGKTARAFRLEEIGEQCKEPVSRSPETYYGLMLSGSSVVDSVHQIDRIRERFPAAVALEMEAHSVYTAVDLAPGAAPQALVIKGVADHGRGLKNSAAQPYASALSVAVAIEFLGWHLARSG